MAPIGGWFVLVQSHSSTVASRTLYLRHYSAQLFEARKLLHTGGVPTSLTLLFGRSLRSLRFVASGRVIHLSPHPPFPVLNMPCGFCGRLTQYIHQTTRTVLRWRLIQLAKSLYTYVLSTKRIHWQENISIDQ